MNLVFLVYDSRSGSTLLSREISAYFPAVLVTPEIRFDELFRRGDAWTRQADAPAVAEVLIRQRLLEKTGLTRSQLLEAIDSQLPRCVRTVIESVCRYLGRETGRDASTVVIKSGMHLRIWPQILRSAPDARFLFIVRDPRAVIHSKLTTGRPYHPRQVMAWAGCAAAALQWRHYASTARRIASRIPLLEVRFEDLLTAPDRLMLQVGAFLGVQSPGRTATHYRIPQAERAIHPRVPGSQFETERIDAWRKLLGRRERAVIEQLCAAEMQLRGYRPDAGSSRTLSLGWTALELLRSTQRIAFEFAARPARRLRFGGPA